MKCWAGFGPWPSGLASLVYMLYIVQVEHGALVPVGSGREVRGMWSDWKADMHCSLAEETPGFLSKHAWW